MNEEDFDGMVKIIAGPEPQDPPLAVVTRDRIRDLIEKFNDKALRDVARELNVLPLSAIDEERWYGVRPDGDLVSFRLQRPYEAIVEEDLWRRAATLSGALSNYPELEPLVPPPPLNRQTCARCDGSGVINRGRKCICEGLGWMPSIFDEMERRKSADDTDYRDRV